MPPFAQPHLLVAVAAAAVPADGVAVAVAVAPVDKAAMVPIHCFQRRFSVPPVTAAKLYLPRVCLYRRLMKSRRLTASALAQIPTMIPGKVQL